MPPLIMLYLCFMLLHDIIYVSQEFLLCLCIFVTSSLFQFWYHYKYEGLTFLTTTPPKLLAWLCVCHNSSKTFDPNFMKLGMYLCILQGDFDYLFLMGIVPLDHFLNSGRHMFLAPKMNLNCIFFPLWIFFFRNPYTFLYLE